MLFVVSGGLLKKALSRRLRKSNRSLTSVICDDATFWPSLDAGSGELEATDGSGLVGDSARGGGGAGASVAAGGS